MAVVKRGTVFFVLWSIMSGGQDLIVGLVAAGLAVWVSVSIAPPRSAGMVVRPLPLARLIARFLWGSLIAGADVARRAFSPAMPLRLGLLRYETALPPGPARNLFMSVASLMPGTLYTATDESGALIFHCLDVAAPLLAELAEEEARVAAAVGVDIRVLPDAEARAGDRVSSA